MTALDLLFVMGQALMLSSFVYFLGIFIWWRLNQPADLESAERSTELRLSEEPRAVQAPTETVESPHHQGIAPA
jgi:hypothetical protein